MWKLQYLSRCYETDVDRLNYDVASSSSWSNSVCNSDTGTTRIRWFVTNVVVMEWLELV